MQQLDRIRPHRSETLQERGVYVAMTSPILAGARVRLMHRIEIALPMDGVWMSHTALPGLTVYDRCLLTRLAALPAMTPSLVRAASLSAMAEGLAGRRAKAAAGIAIAADEAGRMHTHDHLLRNVIRHFEPGLRASHPADQASRAMDQLAAKTGCGGRTVAAGFAGLAYGLSTVGLGARIATAPIPVLLTEVQALRQAIAGQPQGAARVNEAAMLITGSADRVLSRLAVVMTEIRALADDPVKLARAWIHDQSSLERLIAQAGWLADGWPWLVQAGLSAVNEGFGPQGVATLITRLPQYPGEVPCRFAWQVLPNELGDTDVSAMTARNEDLLARAA